jgi:hypothetical protein
MCIMQASNHTLRFITFCLMNFRVTHVLPLLVHRILKTVKHFKQSSGKIKRQ